MYSVSSKEAVERKSLFAFTNSSIFRVPQQSHRRHFFLNQPSHASLFAHASALPTPLRHRGRAERYIARGYVTRSVHLPCGNTAQSCTVLLGAGVRASGASPLADCCTLAARFRVQTRMMIWNWCRLTAGRSRVQLMRWWLCQDVGLFHASLVSGTPSPALRQVCYTSLLCQCSQVLTRAARHHRATATGVGMKAVGSLLILMLWSLISVVLFSVCTVDGTTEEDVPCIQEWLMMSSKDGRSAGRRDRHHLISCWHSGGGRGGGTISLQH